VIDQRRFQSENAARCAVAVNSKARATPTAGRRGALRNDEVNGD